MDVSAAFTLPVEPVMGRKSMARCPGVGLSRPGAFSRIRDLHGD